MKLPSHQHTTSTAIRGRTVHQQARPMMIQPAIRKTIVPNDVGAIAAAGAAKVRAEASKWGMVGDIVSTIGGVLEDNDRITSQLNEKELQRRQAEWITQFQSTAHEVNTETGEPNWKSASEQYEAAMSEVVQGIEERNPVSFRSAKNHWALSKESTLNVGRKNVGEYVATNAQAEAKSKWEVLGMKIQPHEAEAYAQQGVDMGVIWPHEKDKLLQGLHMRFDLNEIGKMAKNPARMPELLSVRDAIEANQGKYQYWTSDAKNAAVKTINQSVDAYWAQGLMGAMGPQMSNEVAGLNFINDYVLKGKEDPKSVGARDAEEVTRKSRQLQTQYNGHVAMINARDYDSISVAQGQIGERFMSDPEVVAGETTFELDSPEWKTVNKAYSAQLVAMDWQQFFSGTVVDQSVEGGNIDQSVRIARDNAMRMGRMFEGDLVRLRHGLQDRDPAIQAASAAFVLQVEEMYPAAATSNFREDNAILLEAAEMIKFRQRHGLGMEDPGGWNVFSEIEEMRSLSVKEKDERQKSFRTALELEPIEKQIETMLDESDMEAPEDPARLAELYSGYERVFEHYMMFGHSAPVAKAMATHAMKRSWVETTMYNSAMFEEGLYQDEMGVGSPELVPDSPRAYQRNMTMEWERQQYRDFVGDVNATRVEAGMAELIPEEDVVLIKLDNGTDTDFYLAERATHQPIEHPTETYENGEPKIFIKSFKATNTDSTHKLEELYWDEAVTDQRLVEDIVSRMPDLDLPHQMEQRPDEFMGDDPYHDEDGVPVSSDVPQQNIPYDQAYAVAFEKVSAAVESVVPDMPIGMRDKRVHNYLRVNGYRHPEVSTSPYTTSEKADSAAPYKQDVRWDYQEFLVEPNDPSMPPPAATPEPNDAAMPPPPAEMPEPEFTPAPVSEPTAEIGGKGEQLLRTATLYKHSLPYIERHEGYRNVVYNDSKGIPTIGIGFNLTRPDAKAKIEALGYDFDSVRGKTPHQNPTPISDRAIRTLYKQDVADTLRAAAKEFDNFHSLPQRARMVVLDVMFNLGVPKFMTFKGFREAISEGNFKRAALELKWSDPDAMWKGHTPYSQQVKSRADRNIRMLLAAEDD